ncbi:MAG: hypothetical protein H2060_04565 [Azoarcus sp.]|nr:hypothetical protein [Azoarcus sp.]
MTGMKIRLLIAAIADELEENAMKIARSEGALGVTVADARGLGFPEHMTFFGLTYVGREKLLMVLAEADRVEHIAERMNVELGLLAPFQGLAFCMDVEDHSGLDLCDIGGRSPDE